MDDHASRTALMLPTAHYFSPPRFWSKLGRYARRAGREVVEKALWLYFAAQRPDTPRWAKATVYGALAVATLAAYIDDAVRARAARVLARWFN